MGNQQPGGESGDHAHHRPGHGGPAGDFPNSGFHQHQQSPHHHQQQQQHSPYVASSSGGGAGYMPRPHGGQQQSQSQSNAPGGMNNNNNNHGATPMEEEQSTPNNNTGWLDDDTVPTVFRWEHGGRQVYITGTFNGWSRQIPMHRSGNDFTYIHNLKRGKHAFKFIVDDEWRFAPDQPTVADIEGRINNFIDVTEFKAYTGDRDFEKEKAAAEYGAAPVTTTTTTSTAASAVTVSTVASSTTGTVGGTDGSTTGPTVPPGANNVMSDSAGTAAAAAPEEDAAAAAAAAAKLAQLPDRDGEVFSQNMPDLDEYTKEPPPLPPHLRHIILNKPPQLQDTVALPVPQHVALNHLYCTAIRDNMMVLGITQRYKTKFVTTVYYSPC